jgi:hypothetical protein
VISRRHFLARVGLIETTASPGSRWLYAQEQGGVVESFRRRAATATIDIQLRAARGRPEQRRGSRP